MKRTVLVMLLVLAGCGTSSHERALERLARAERDMQACKQQVGLPSMPTPDTTALFERVSQGRPFTPEMAAEMRVKVECAIPLTELLEARQAAGVARTSSPGGARHRGGAG